MQDTLTKIVIVRRKLRELAHAEKYLTEKLYQEMGNSDRIRTENFTAERKQITRSIMKKKNVPDEVWAEYSEPIRYTTLRIKPL